MKQYPKKHAKGRIRNVILLIVILSTLSGCLTNQTASRVPEFAERLEETAPYTPEQAEVVTDMLDHINDLENPFRK